MTSHAELPLGTREYVELTLTSDDDLTAGSVEVAFPTRGTSPSVWSAASWVSGETNTIQALITEPGSGVPASVELAAGMYDAWARITIGSERVLIHAGTVEVFDPASTAYARWGMDVAAAAALTGITRIGSVDLQDAEAELVDALGWRPDPDDYDATTERFLAMGRAVAWQAAYRADRTPAATDGVAVIESESITDHSVTYARPVTVDEVLAPRARQLLVRWGWFAQSRTGRTSDMRYRPADFQTS